jgi:ribosomal protein L13E
MSNALQRWFDRARVRIAPVQTNGREAAFSDGYSLLELERAGLSEADAQRLAIPVDRSRMSALGSNVMQLEKLRKIQGR